MNLTKALTETAPPPVRTPARTSRETGSARALRSAEAQAAVRGMMPPSTALAIPQQHCLPPQRPAALPVVDHGALANSIRADLLRDGELEQLRTADDESRKLQREGESKSISLVNVEISRLKSLLPGDTTGTVAARLVELRQLDPAELSLEREGLWRQRDETLRAVSETVENVHLRAAAAMARQADTLEKLERTICDSIGLSHEPSRLLLVLRQGERELVAAGQTVSYPLPPLILALLAAAPK